MKKKIKIIEICRDEDTQSRAGLNNETVDEYLKDMKNGDVFPEVVLFKSKADKIYYVGDGWHRLYAREKLGEKSIDAEIKDGTRRDAILYSVRSNTAHGLRRTNEDKRRAVTILLSDAEWSQWSAREIARRCSVDEKLVRNIKKELSADKPQMLKYPRNKKALRAGKEYSINTENIGRKAISMTEENNVRAIEQQVNGEIISESNNPELKKFSLFGIEIHYRIVKKKRK